MATEALKSTSITFRDNLQSGAATTPSSKQINGGTYKLRMGVFEMTAATTIGSTYRVCEVPKASRIDKIVVKCDAAIVAAAIDIGLYETTAMGGAAVDQDCYASAYDIAGAGTVDQVEINLRWESASFEFGANLEQFVWQDAGVATAGAAHAFYDIVATTTVAATTGGSLAILVYYTDGS